MTDMLLYSTPTSTPAAARLVRVNKLIPPPTPSAKAAMAKPLFALRIAELIRRELVATSTLAIPKNNNVYMSGDHAQDIFLVERGQIKLHMIAPEGRSCVFDVYAEGDVFGESCLLGLQVRTETATAMLESKVRKIPFRHLLSGSGVDKLVLSLLDHLASRIYEQQLLITNLVIDDSKKRLGKTLLYIAQKHGVATLLGTKLTIRLSHQDLSEMIGTTRPRVSEFMYNFRQAECVVADAEHHLIIDEAKLDAYIMNPPGLPNHR